MPINAKGFPLKAQGEREGDLPMPQRKTMNALGIANGTRSGRFNSPTEGNALTKSYKQLFAKRENAQKIKIFHLTNQVKSYIIQ